LGLLINLRSNGIWGAKEEICTLVNAFDSSKGIGGYFIPFI